MRIVVAPDKFKDSLTASEAAEAIGRGLRQALPDADVVTVPVADGGEGTVDAVVTAGYHRHTAWVEGPTGRPVKATFATCGHIAVIEMAEASGLRQLPNGAAAPLRASTRGTGQLITAALDLGAQSLMLGVGGSATTDGGAGMLQALGARLLDVHGQDLSPGGAALARIEHIDLSALDRRLRDTEVVVATDVDNPLIGPRGAAAVFGPQKGAGAVEIELLDRALSCWSVAIERDLGVSVAAVSGGGAAGGTAAGAFAALGARLSSGIDLVLDFVGLADALQGADLVVTGEGSFDEQSLSGKAPIGVARRAHSAGVPSVVLAGRLTVSQDSLAQFGILHAHALTDETPDPETAMRDASTLLERLVASRTTDWIRPARIG